MRALSVGKPGPDLSLAEMYREVPVFDPSVDTLSSQRIAKAARPLAEFCRDHGGHFGILTISYRELLGMIRVFGPEVVAKIHERVIGLLRKELPSECFVISGQHGLVLFMKNVTRGEAFQLALHLESVLCGSFHIDGFNYGVNFVLSTGEFPGFASKSEMSLEEFHRLYTVYEEENFEIYKDTGTCVFAITEERFHMLSQMHELDQRMRDDFVAGRFHMHYQPRVELVSGRVVGAEALMRWNSTHDGPVPPGVFVPISEKNGLIHSLTPFAVRTVARDLAGLRDAFGPEFTVGVNLSGVCIRSRNLVGVIRDCMSEHGVADGGIEVEITESQLIDQRAFVIEQLNELRNAGIATALDDFGTGFSSLHVLTTIPLDYLKLDRSFISVLSKDPREKHAAIARSIAEMGAACGMQVIAEGMETAEEVRILIEEVGCPLGQGYFFAKPMSLDDFLALPKSL